MKKTIYLVLIALTNALYSQNTHAQTLERPKAQVFYQVPRDSAFFKASDSLTYFYIGNAAHDTLSYASGYDSSYRWRTADGTNYAPYSFTNNLWYADNKIQSDTLWQWDSTNHTYYIFDYATCNYDAARNVISTLEQKRDTTNNVWIDEQRFHYIYNSAGQRTYTAWEVSPYGTWDTTSTISTTYNSNNSVANTTNRRFTFSGSQSTHVYYVIYTQYTYDNLGRIDTTFTSYKSNDTSNWYQQNRTISHYDAAGDLTVQQTQQLDSSGWHNTMLLTSTYDAGHNQMQYIQQGTDSAGNWINTIRFQYTYDSYNMMTSYIQNGWDTANGGSWKPTAGYRMVHYYYETFNLPSGIAEIAQVGQARLYPVPAADMLSLDITWNEAQPSTATIYDVTGKQQSQFTLPDAATYHGYIPAYTLPAGIYTLQIKGTKGSITKSFNVLK